MHTTEFPRANLAIRPMRDRVDPRLQLRRLQVAFVAIVHGAKRMPTRWYGLTERHRTVSFPFERERQFVHEAIQLGCTTPMQVMSWHLARLADDLAQFPDAPCVSDVCYIRLMAEQAEALEAQARARGLRTAEADAIALRESEEAIAALQLYVTGVRRAREG